MRLSLPSCQGPPTRWLRLLDYSPCSGPPALPEPEGPHPYILPNYNFVQLVTEEGEKTRGQEEKAEVSVMRF